MVWQDWFKCLDFLEFSKNLYIFYDLNMRNVICTFAMPSNTNYQGNIFGGWILSQMDIAGSIESRKNSPGTFVTIGVDKMKFIKPVSVGDLVKIYTDVHKIGNTSITINVKVCVDKLCNGEEIIVATGLFTYVKIDKDKKPMSILVE